MKILVQEFLRNISSIKRRKKRAIFKQAKPLFFIIENYMYDDAFLEGIGCLRKRYMWIKHLEETRTEGKDFETET